MQNRHRRIKKKEENIINSNLDYTYFGKMNLKIGDDFYKIIILDVHFDDERRKVSALNILLSDSFMVI
jgi:hypothetical protein